MTKSEKWAEGIGWLLLTLGAGLRVLGAWGMRAVMDVDASVVALMARHMAKGTDWPVFFYGQGYMGSVEPAGSALLMKLFGDNGFWLGMGPVVFSVVALWALWRWAKVATGPWGGVAALLLATVGPLVYFSFQSAARGGYMVSLCVDALVLWGAAGLAGDWWEGKGGGVWSAGALGLLAGVGIWTDPIVVPALGAAGVVLLVGMKGRFWRHWGAVTAGVAGTVAGASPWWLWLVRHGGSIMELPAGAQKSLKALVELTWDRYLLFQGEGLSPRLCTVLALAGMVLAAMGLVAWLAAMRRKGARANFATLGAVLFAGLFAVAFVFSGFTQARTGRYWVPMWPAMALLGGWACVGWTGADRRGLWGRVAAWGWSGALVAAQTVLVTQKLGDLMRAAPNQLARLEGFGKAIDATGADAVMAPLPMYVLNYGLRERVPVSDGLVTFYEPIRKAAELAENPAYFSDWKGVPVLIERMGMTCEQEARGQLCHHVTSPPQWRVLAWRLNALSGTSAEVRLDPPQAVSRVAFFIHGVDKLRRVPLRFDIEVMEDGEWRKLYDNDGVLPLSWSGTRAYTDAGGYQEYPIMSERAEALRVSARGMLKHRLRQLDILAYGMDSVAKDCSGDGDAAVQAVLALAGTEAAVFAPRWLANRLHRSGRLDDTRNRGLSVRMFGTLPPEERVAYPAETPVVAAVERRYAGLVREAFARAGIKATETSSPDGPDAVWAIFQAEAAEPETALVWNDRWFCLAEGKEGE